MGEMAPPTAGDYAWAAAQTAQRQNQGLAQRIEHLENYVDMLVDRIIALEQVVFARK